MGCCRNHENQQLELDQTLRSPLRTPLSLTFLPWGHHSPADIYLYRAVSVVFFKACVNGIIVALPFCACFCLSGSAGPLLLCGLSLFADAAPPHRGASLAVEHRLPGARASAIALQPWDLCGPGITSVPPELAGGVLTAGPQGSPVLGFYSFPLFLWEEIK